ncbi:putative Cystatin domain-containing protein [Rosa chinensis]|uniref:Putative Cystatin domain-containing protein n=1 Tax=Rosa chinensis TaxID=74649 RepID=A0A2P6QTH2_ROSCH|nr:putative Cystatin domain-containing protein [Rosa chinensis]
MQKWDLKYGFGGKRKTQRLGSHRRKTLCYWSNDGGELQFREVVEVQTQVVSGIKYYLKVSTVRNGGAPSLFDS